jgi:hypothetical protein
VTVCYANCLLHIIITFFINLNYNTFSADSLCTTPSIDDLVHRRLLVTRSRHDVLVVRRNVTTQHARRFFRLEYAGTVGCSPRVQQIVLPRRNEPLPAGGESQTQHATLVQMQLVLVGLGGVEHFHVGILHADGEPLTRRTIPQREYLRAEVVLLQLPSLPQVPTSDSIVQTAGPQLGPVGGYIDARGTVRVSLELSH